MQNWLHFWVFALWSSLLALALISHLLSFVLMSLRYKFHRYGSKKGYRYSTWLSISQHHVYSDPSNPAHRNRPRDLLRKYALVSLQIHTAATNHTIEGLPVAQAERLRNHHEFSRGGQR